MLKPLRIDIDALSATPPSFISSDLLKAHTRIESAEDDALLAVYLRAAITWAENATHRNIYKRPVRWVLQGFPACDGDYRIELPRGKTQLVSSIIYSQNGSPTTLTGPSSGADASPPGAGGSDYQEDLTGDTGGLLLPPRGASWPSADCDVATPVKITFTAGWDSDAVPADLVHAILFTVEDMVDMRGTVDMPPTTLNAIGTAGARLSVRESLISPYCLNRIY